MGKTSNTVFEAIEMLFDTLPQEQQVLLMVNLYYEMSDAQKDEFLEETENA